MIISDKTKTNATVTFVGLDGETMKTEQVAFGSSATAPALPTTDEEGWDIRWDTDYTNVQGDLTVKAVKEMTVHMDLSPTECASLKQYNKNTGLSFTSGNATVTLKGERDEDGYTAEMRAIAEALTKPEGDPYENARKLGFYCEQCG